MATPSKEPTMKLLRAQHILATPLDTPEHRRTIRMALHQDLSIQLLAYLDTHGPHTVTLTWHEDPAPWDDAVILSCLVRLVPVGEHTEEAR